MRRAMSMSEAGVARTLCPGCCTIGNLVPILYGFHSADDEERARSGKAVLGTYSEGPGAPRFECLTCGARIR